MDPAKIKRALAYVHASERSSLNPGGYPRDTAARLAAEALGLTRDERGVLYRALHVAAD